MKEVKISLEELKRLMNAKSRGDRRIMVKEHTLWSKTEIKVLAYLKKSNNKPSTYLQIARAYGSSSYSNYKRACDDLHERGHLLKSKKGFKLGKTTWNDVKRGTETVQRAIPYLEANLKKLQKRQK